MHCKLRPALQDWSSLSERLHSTTNCINAQHFKMVLNVLRIFIQYSVSLVVSMGKPTGLKAFRLFVIWTNAIMSTALAVASGSTMVRCKAFNLIFTADAMPIFLQTVSKSAIKSASKSLMLAFSNACTKLFLHNVSSITLLSRSFLRKSAISATFNLIVVTSILPVCLLVLPAKSKQNKAEAGPKALRAFVTSKLWVYRSLEAKWPCSLAKELHVESLLSSISVEGRQLLHK